MSSLCHACGVFKITDDDLARQYVISRRNGRSRVLLERRVHIQLHFDFTFGRESSKARLGPASWRGGTSNFCGSCAFCSLLQEGLHRTLKSRCRELSTQHQSNEGGVAQIMVTLESLEYLKDPSPWVIGKKQLKTWDVFIVALRGYADLAQAGAILNSMEVAVPFELFAEKDDIAAKHLNIHRRPLDESVLSEANLSKVNSWLKDCDENHKNCCEDATQSGELIAGQRTQFLPTRLIDVGSSTQHPRLAITSDSCDLLLQRRGNIRYLALSYCWGSAEDKNLPLRTTQENFDDRLAGIPENILPRAFLDAINIARVLQIQYIWIDSLCIIQDNHQDWETESSTMANIFRNAYLTVIAAAGYSSHDSFLRRDTHPAYCSIPFKSIKHPLVEGQYSLRYRPGTKWWGTDKMAEISGCRWINRGWAFQEERLARRVLMFGENKFFFDCRTMERMEDTEMCGPRPEWLEVMCEIPELEEKDMAEVGTGGVSRNRLALTDHWHTLCNHYSRRELTFSEDKLPAFSGIASKIAEKVRSDYLGGLWKDNLTHDLFWQTNGTVRKPARYRAPSWSWAALDAEVRWKICKAYETKDCKMYCTILDAQTTVAGLDPFGAIKDGYLKISGAALEVDLLWVGDLRTPRHPWRVYLNNEEIARADLDAEKNEPEAGLRERRRYALLVAMCAGLESPPSGLLLHKTGRERDGLDEFQRDGIFCILPYISPEASHAWERSNQVIMMV